MGDKNKHELCVEILKEEDLEQRTLLLNEFRSVLYMYLFKEGDRF